MASITKLTGILWLALGMWVPGTSILFASLFQPRPSSISADTVLVPPNRLLVQAGGAALLEADGITLVTATDQALLLNTDSLFFLPAVTAGRIRIRQPTSWRSYLSLLLREQGERDSSTAWQTARLKLFTFIKTNPANSALTDEKLIERFVSTVQRNQQAGNITLIRHRQLILDRLSIRRLSTTEQLLVIIKQKNTFHSGDHLLLSRIISIVLWLALTLLIWYLIRNPLPSIHPPKVVADSEGVVQEFPEAAESVELISSTAEINPDELVLPKAEPNSSDLFMSEIDQYVDAFLRQYGGFYKRIQQLPLDASDEDRRHIRREFVEMALHAYDFMSVSTYKDPQRFAQIPNIQLLLSGHTINQFPADRYRTLSLDPYQTEKRYRLLLRILRELDIGELEGALLNDVYVPKSLLTSPNLLS